MASVCGGCLAMEDAGVPLKQRVAGVAMGLILNTSECGGDGTPLILTDILGSEDALGDMDFKVEGMGRMDGWGKGGSGERGDGRMGEWGRGIRRGGRG